MKAIIVDDELRYTSLLKDILELKNIEAFSFEEVGTALTYFISMREAPIEFIAFIDLSLPIGFMPRHLSGYHVEGGREGLMLVDILAQEEILTSQQLKRVVISTAHRSNNVVHEIDKRMKQFGISYFPKRPNLRINDYHNMVDQLVKS